MKDQLAENGQGGRKGQLLREATLVVDGCKSVHAFPSKKSKFSPPGTGTGRRMASVRPPRFFLSPRWSPTAPCHPARGEQGIGCSPSTAGWPTTLVAAPAGGHEVWFCRAELDWHRP